MASAFAIGRQAQALQTAVSLMSDAIESDDWSAFVRTVDTITRQADVLHGMVTEFNQDLARGNHG